MEEFFNYYGENHQLFRGIFDRIYNSIEVRFAQEFEGELVDINATVNYIAIGSQGLLHMCNFLHVANGLKIQLFLPNGILQNSHLLTNRARLIYDFPNDLLVHGAPSINIYTAQDYEGLQNHITDWIIGTYRYQLSLMH